MTELIEPCGALSCVPFSMLYSAALQMHLFYKNKFANFQSPTAVLRPTVC